MTAKQYRRLTRGLFLLLFVVFLLLFLLLSHQYRTASTTSGGWENRYKQLSTVLVSDTHSSGFMVDALPLAVSTRIGAEDFSENIASVQAEILNEGDVTVRVSTALSGTNLSSESALPPGLCCAFYYYSGETDPFAGNLQAFFSGNDLETISHEKHNVCLSLRRTDYPTSFTLAPGERKTLVLFFWADADQVTTLTDLVAQSYSVTAKFTSRAA